MDSSSSNKKKKKNMFGFSKAWRVLKTLFFVIAMIVSFLLCAMPVLVSLIDVVLPSALFSSLAGSPLLLSPPVIAAKLKRYSFTSSLVDVPLVSIFRSILTLCAYGISEGRGGFYLSISTTCSLLSVVFVALKAVYMFGVGTMKTGWPFASSREGLMAEALFFSSLVLGSAHMLAAYRTSCRQRRKLLVYRIDIEAVSVYKSDLINYKKISSSK